MKRKYTGVILTGRQKRRRSNGNVVRVVTNRGYAPIASRGFRGIYGGKGQYKRPRSELKTIEVNDSTVAANTTGTIVLINGVIQGTDYNQRVGRIFLMKSIYLRAKFTNDSATVSPLTFRAMIVLDSQTNGALPAITDILNAVTTTSTNNLNNRDRFKVLMDKTFSPTPSARTVAITEQEVFKKWYKKCSYEVVNGGTAATVGSIQTGGLYVIFLTDVAAGTGDGVVTYSTRVRFIDN